MFELHSLFTSIFFPIAEIYSVSWIVSGDLNTFKLASLHSFTTPFHLIIKEQIFALNFN